MTVPPKLRIAADRCDVAIIGGGCAGTLTAVQLARLAQRPLRIAIYDRAGAFARGAAYGPSSDACLLNVRAKAMGAFPDAEDDFLQWLRATGYASGDSGLGERFVPRRLYGAYLSALLDRCAGGGLAVERRVAAVTALAPAGDEYVVETACGARTLARAVVVATGNLPPNGSGDPGLAAALRAHARNPWEVLAAGPVSSAAEVLIVGTGLTALDVMLHLATSGHRGRVTMLSRHGYFPLAHAEPGAGAPPAPATCAGGAPLEVLREVRRAVRAAASQGHGWHDAIDGLRPHVNRVWDSWSPRERQQFFRHLAPIWEIHRHRSPPATLAVRDRLIAAGQLDVRSGRLVSLAAGPDGLRAEIRPRGSTSATALRVDVVVDCTGPRRDIVNSGDPLSASLVARGLARPGVLGHGLAAAPDGALNTDLGRGPLYALGPPLRGNLSESSAVREIRVQARLVAEAIASALAPANDARLRRAAGQ
jgi:uncharacterized NAD(P)/FAD-binding protein YdhS